MSLLLTLLRTFNQPDSPVFEDEKEPCRVDAFKLCEILDADFRCHRHRRHLGEFRCRQRASARVPVAI